MGRAILLRLYLKKQRAATWNMTTAVKTPVVRLFLFCFSEELVPVSAIAFDPVPNFSSASPAPQVTSVDPINAARYFIPKEHKNP